ncbi:MAG TPA: DUF1428 domain-containing protein [Prosthecobacter sp.]
MPSYVDGFVIPVPKANIEVYKRVAKKASKVWKDHGALAYFECVGDDMDVKDMTSFPKLAKAKEDEVVVFSWAVFKSRKDRDKANKAIMSDQRIANMMGDCKNIFNAKRMAYGGFKVIVEA